MLLSPCQSLASSSLEHPPNIAQVTGPAGGQVVVCLASCSLGCPRFPGQVCLYPMSGASIHPPNCLCLGSWRAGELRSQVRWWLAQGLVWFKASLGYISLISKHFVILSSLEGLGIPHWGVSPCGFPVCIRALNSGWISNLIRVAHSFQCSETAACPVQCDT